MEEHRLNTVRYSLVTLLYPTRDSCCTTLSWNEMIVLLNQYTNLRKSCEQCRQKGDRGSCRCTKRRRARKSTRIRDLTARQGALSGYRVRAGQGRTETECWDVGVSERAARLQKKDNTNAILTHFWQNYGGEGSHKSAEARKRFPPFASRQRHVACHHFIIPITRCTFI